MKDAEIISGPKPPEPVNIVQKNDKKKQKKNSKHDDVLGEELYAREIQLLGIQKRYCTAHNGTRQKRKRRA